MTIVRGAGGVVWRRGSDGIEVVLVHRADRGVWSFPKGKLDPGEDEPTAALREVREETGLTPTLGADLGTVVYRDAKDRPRIVRYYAMRSRTPNDAPRPANEIDDARWFALERCGGILTNDADRGVLGRFRPPGR